MDFGIYLAFGVRGRSPTQRKEVVEQDAAEPEARESRVLRRLGKCLSSMGLTPFSSQVLIVHISKLIQSASEGSEHPLPHVLPYLLSLLHARIPESIEGVDRAGCPQIIPGLRAIPYWPTNLFSWVAELESNLDIVREEFMALRATLAGFQEYRSSNGQESTDMGSWHVCYLSLHGVDFADNAARCPRTMEMFKRIPRFYHHAMFSALDKETHVTAHYGPTNKKLRCFLPLYVPQEQCWLRVNHEKHYLTAGRCVIFDDSFYHEASNDSATDPRIVLIFDIWHPDLTDAEIHVLEFINKAQILAAKRLVQQQQQQQQREQGEDETADFLSTIMRGKHTGIAEEASLKIWGNYTSSFSQALQEQPQQPAMASQVPTSRDSASTASS